MAKVRLTMDDLLELQQSGKLGGTAGEQQKAKIKFLEEKQKREDEKNKGEGKRSFFQGRRDKRTVLSRIKAMQGEEA